MSNRTKQAWGYLLMFIWALLTIMTCAAVWNFVASPTLIVSAILLLISNGFAIRKAVKFLSKLDKEE